MLFYRGACALMQGIFVLCASWEVLGSLEGGENISYLLSHISYLVESMCGNILRNGVWQEAINSAMADVEKPNGITNSWRLPTLEEVSTILQDVRLAKLGSSGTTSPLYYQDGSQIKWAYAKYENNAYEIKTGQAFASYIYLWPVIDISY